jgi:hypothetical protein
MSVKKNLILIDAFMKIMPTYKPSSLIVASSEKYVLRVLKQNKISADLTIRGVPVKCIGSAKSREVGV